MLFLFILVYLKDDDTNKFTGKNTVTAIIVGVSVFVSCVIIMAITVLAVAVLYKKKMKSSKICHNYNLFAPRIYVATSL